MAETDEVKPMPRGLPMVATWRRWATATVIFGIAFVLLARAYLGLSHTQRTLGSLLPVIAGACLFLAGLLWTTLRSEEVRLARELRVARSGTSALRAIGAHRRQPSPSLTRLLSTTLGTA